jgi:restriction endonuclease S subunit
MKPYPAYKPSGVPWLGEVPSHWEYKAAKFVVTCNDDVLTEDVDPATEIAYVEISDVEEGQGIKATTGMTFKDAPSRARRQVKHGDIIVSTVRTYLKAIAPIENPPENLVVSTGFAVLRPHNIAQGFAKYAFAESGFINTVIARSNGVSYPAINATDLVRIPIPVPPVAEQQAITVYLNRETARIDMLIAEKGRLIDTLREYRQATISEVVTKGLNPATPKKPSGVLWLGEIPAHWGLKRLKFHVEQVGEKTSEPLADVTYIGLEHIESGTGKFISSIDGTQTESESTVSHFRVGDVLFGKLRPYLAKAVIAYGDGVCTTELLVLRPHSMDSGYLLRCLLLDGFIKTVDASTFGAKMPRADWTFISNLLLPEPPVVEQQVIAAYLDRETARIDKLVAHVQDEIKLLQELRAATITDAVTGKIQVS